LERKPSTVKAMENLMSGNGFLWTEDRSEPLYGKRVLGVCGEDFRERLAYNTEEITTIGHLQADAADPHPVNCCDFAQILRISPVCSSARALTGSPDSNSAHFCFPISHCRPHLSIRTAKHRILFEIEQLFEQA
jgi:hypothetical protein